MTCEFLACQPTPALGGRALRTFHTIPPDPSARHLSTSFPLRTLLLSLPCNNTASLIVPLPIFAVGGRRLARRAAAGTVLRGALLRPGPGPLRPTRLILKRWWPTRLIVEHWNPGIGPCYQRMHSDRAGHDSPPADRSGRPARWRARGARGAGMLRRTRRAERQTLRRVRSLRGLARGEAGRPP